MKTHAYQLHTHTPETTTAPAVWELMYFGKSSADERFRKSKDEH